MERRLFLPDSPGVTLTLNSPLTLNVAGLAAALISRSIAGTGDLIKEGAGFLVLDKTNTYSGQTIIRAGILAIDGLQPDSPVLLDGGTVEGGGTMGTISATATGGTISVGRSGGKDLMSSGSVTLNPTTTFAVEVNGNQHDQLNVNGTVTLGDAILSVTGLPPTEPIVIIDNNLNDAVVGTFAGLPQGATMLVGGVTLTISYTGGDGNDVVLDPGGVSEVLTGIYVGNGVDNRQITGLGFHPDVVIIKSILTQQAVVRTSTMTGDVSKNMATGEIVSNAIQSLDPSGFTVGTIPQVNSVPGLYQWVAWKTGSGGDDGRDVHRKRHRIAIDHGPRVLAGYRLRHLRGHRPTRAQSARRASLERVHVRRRSVHQLHPHAWMRTASPSVMTCASTGAAPPITTSPGLRFPERWTLAPTPGTALTTGTSRAWGSSRTS